MPKAQQHLIHANTGMHSLQHIDVHTVRQVGWPDVHGRISDKYAFVLADSLSPLVRASFTEDIHPARGGGAAQALHMGWGGCDAGRGVAHCTWVGWPIYNLHQYHRLRKGQVLFVMRTAQQMHACRTSCPTIVQS